MAWKPNAKPESEKRRQPFQMPGMMRVFCCRLWKMFFHGKRHGGDTGFAGKLLGSATWWPTFLSRLRAWCGTDPRLYQLHKRHLNDDLSPVWRLAANLPV